MPRANRNARFYLIALTVLFLLPTFAHQARAQESATTKEKRSVASIGKIIDRAGRLYKSGKYKSAADKISDAQKKLMSLAKEADAELHALIQPEYKRLSKAHQLLIDKKQKLKALAALPAPANAESIAVSFKTQVAPILVANCGNCHVRQQRGDFSTATYDALMDSTHVATGKPDESRIVEVIVDGEMPPGNRKVAEKDLQILKQWIAAGAKFDGDNSAANLNDLAPRPARDARPMAVAKPTGGETVSFGLHVAPVLIEKCGSCHIDRDRPQGGFSMATFRQLLRGGRSGTPIAAGESMKSALIARLSGDGVEVMPPRNKLDQNTISLITKWIDEGAKFDGNNPRTGTKMIAASAKANSQTHAELFADRKTLAGKNWKLVMSDIQSTSLENDQVRVVGSAEKSRLSALKSMADTLIEKTAATLKANANKPLVKGGITIYVFETRYDFNELGVMIAGHKLPKDTSSYWQSDPVDAFGSILLSKNKEPQSAEATLAAQIGALYASNLAPDVPRWFADGVGHQTASRILPRNETVKSWTAAATETAAQIQNPADLLSGRLGEQKTAMASLFLVQQLKKSQLNNLLNLTQEKQSFIEAFQQQFGKTPEEFFRRSGRRDRPR